MVEICPPEPQLFQQLGAPSAPDERSPAEDVLSYESKSGEALTIDELGLGVRTLFGAFPSGAVVT